MKRRKWMMLLGGFCLAGCGEKKKTKEAEISWIEMKGQWEALSGGQVDVGETLRIGWGERITNVKWKGEVPTVPFELELEARRIDGSDFFCAVTFPVRNSGECVTLVLGGWGGGTVGISSIDGLDASENESSSSHVFQTNVWYRIRLVRGQENLRVWIDEQKVIDVDTTGKKLSLREGEIEECAPFGLSTWQTTGEVRGLRWRKLQTPGPQLK